MIATRIASVLTGIAVAAGAISMTNLAVAPPAEASIGCCMVRVDRSSEWLQSGQSFNDCKRMNTEKDGEKDKLLKKSGLVWWNLRC